MTGQKTGQISICFVSPNIYQYLPSYNEKGVGGAEQQEYLLSKHLIDEGFHVSFVTRKYDDSGNFEEVNGIDVYKSIPEITGVRNAPRKIVGIFLGLYRADAKIYYVRSGTLFAIITAIFCELFGRSLVYAAATDKDVSPRRQHSNLVLRALTTRAIRRAEKVIVQTRHQQELFSQNYGQESTVISNGLSLPPESEIIDHEYREFVLWVGRIDREQKHPERYIRLAERLPEIEFLMIGAPVESEEKYYDEIRERAKNVPNLDFVGYVPPEEIDDYYRRAFALVNTSDYEGFPNVFLEAWRYATPVISLYFSLGGEIEDNEIGYVSGDEDTLRRDVETIVTDTELRSRLGEKSREHMKGHYSFEKTAEDYRSVFHSIENSI